MTLRTFPMNLSEANALVRGWHRHNGELRSGCFFAIGALETSAQAAPLDAVRGPNGERVVGAVVVGSVSARLLYKPWAAEVRRLVTDGTKNACSLLYGAAWRAAQALGYEGMITFTLTAEPGVTLRASNWRLDEAHVPMRVWKSRSPEYAHLRWSERPTTGNSPSFPRLRWFIGRRIPSQSSIVYVDDPAECHRMRLQNEVRMMSWQEAFERELKSAGVVSTVSTSALQAESPRPNRGPRMTSQATHPSTSPSRSPSEEVKSLNHDG